MQLFIAAIIALFFWGRTTKDIEEKTELASKGRTIVYLFFVVIVGIFYYKTYQVATLFNYVSVEGVRLSYDSLGNVADTVDEITIENKFETGHFALIKEKELKEKFGDPDNRELGGTFVKFRAHNYGPFSIKQVNENESIDYKPYGIPSEELGQVGRIMVCNNYTPSLIPIFPSFEDSIEEKIDGFKNIAIYDLKKHPEILGTEIIDRKINNNNDTIITNEPLFDNGSIVLFTFASNKKHKEPLTYVKLYAISTMYNSFGFFTAADVSQYTQVVQIESECPIRALNVGYDIPIETERRDSDMQVEERGFTVRGERLNRMNNKACMFHVKLPTLSNLQLIRSLILTTLLTALVSLFFANLFYCLRKWFVNFRNKHMDLFSEEKIKRFWRIMYWILLVVFLIIVYLTYCVLYDKPIHINVEYLEINYIVGFIILTISLLFIVIYYTYKQACKGKGNSKNE